MSYNLKDVFYLAIEHEYSNSDYTNANEMGILAVDISAYVDPIAKGSRRGQGLAVYKVHAMAGTTHNGPVQSSESAGCGYALTVKPYTSTGDGLTSGIDQTDLGPASDVCIWSGQMFGTASYNGPTSIFTTCEPSADVPFVCVRDTIYALFLNNAVLQADQMVSYRLECAMITLDTATLNQLLRTQTV